MTKQHLSQLSRELLHLHKALLNFQQKEYEGKYGVIGSPNKLLDLLMTNPEFAWLRTLSELIVGIDEVVDSKEQGSEQQIVDLVNYSKNILSESPTDFSKKYLTALQKSPQVVLAHGKVIQILNSSKP